MKSLAKLRRSIFVPVFFISTSMAYSQSFDTLNDALAAKDYNAAVKAVVDDAGESYILDALCTSEEFAALDYEELLILKNSVRNGKALSAFLDNRIENCKIEIYNSINDLTVEQVLKYCESFPERKSLVMQYLDATLYSNLSELNCLELYYLELAAPRTHEINIKDELNNRQEEKQELLASHVQEFLQQEKSTRSQLKYMLELIIWSYFIEGHKSLTNAYADIYMVPDAPLSAVSQYQNLVRRCYTPMVLQKMLQEQINKYCEQVNKARRDYALIAGKSDYIKCSYTIPAMHINSNANSAPFYEILDARETYVRAQQNISEGTSIIGFFAGSLWGLGLQAIGDWINISELVDAEYGCRKKYVDEVHEKLNKSFSDYASRLIGNIDNYMEKNQKEYETFIRK